MMAVDSLGEKNVSEGFGFGRYLRRILYLYKARKSAIRFRKRFSRCNLLTQNISENYKRSIQEYWKKHYGKSINPLWHQLISNHTKVEDVRYMPNDIWRGEIVPYFNNLLYRPAFIDKNLSEIFLGNDIKVPKTIIKRMRGLYYDDHNQPLMKKHVHDVIQQSSGEQIVKGSQTDNGVGIRLLIPKNNILQLGKNVTTLNDLERIYGNDFIIQEKLAQHHIMAEPHPGSVNTIRVLTFRFHMKIHILFTLARFGINNSINDNVATGGLACGINHNGKLNARAVDHFGFCYVKHPSTNYSFNNRIVVPGFSQICECAKKLHQRIYHFNLVAWDFVVGQDEEPIFLEMNYLGPSAEYQLIVEKPIFGDFTEEVLHAIRDKSAMSKY